MRVLAVDLGRRRIGLAISDRSRTLARPLTTLVVSGGDAEAVDRLASEASRLASEEDGLGEIVVGLPGHLDGSPSDRTADTHRIVEALKQRVTVPVLTEDERLTSREAESRLAVREKDWRKRKAQIDAAAAAVFLQDYLDRRA